MVIKAIKKFNLVALDTNIFIYHYQGSSIFAPQSAQIFDLLTTIKLQAITSIVSLIELLSFKASADKIRELREAFEQTPNLTVFEVNKEIAIEAAEIRRAYGFRTADAIQ